MSTVLGLWDVVNNLTRLRPSRPERYRVTIFGSSRARPGTFAYEEVKRVAGVLAEMGCDIVTGGGPGLMQAANERAVAVGSPQRDRSVGIRVSLPCEQRVNPLVGPMRDGLVDWARTHLLNPELPLIRLWNYPPSPRSLYHTSRIMELELVGIDCRGRVDFLKIDAKRWQQPINARVSTKGDTLTPLSPRIRKYTPCPSRSNVIRMLGERGRGWSGAFLLKGSKYRAFFSEVREGLRTL